MFKRYRIDNYEIDFSKGPVSGFYFLHICRLDAEERRVGGYSVLRQSNVTGGGDITETRLTYHSRKGPKPPRKVELFCEGLMAGFLAAQESTKEAA